MNPALPIHEREGETLELKSLAALTEPETIAREAVAMLNAKGGSVWVGIREGTDRNEIEPIADAAEAEQRRRRLQDHLLDMIEPVPIRGEVAVTAVPITRNPEENGRILRVDLRPVAGRGPYAVLRHGARHFVRRFDNRVVPMTRQELLGALQANQSSTSRDKAAAVDTLKAELARLVRQLPGIFWMGLEPEHAGDLKLRGLRETELLADPTLSGTPRGGFDFTAAGYGGAPRITDGGALTIGGTPLSLRILRSGGVRFEAALEEVFWVGRVPLVDEEHLLSPEALTGYPISVFRLVGRLLAEPSLWHRPPQGDVWAALAITGLQSWGLLPGDQGEWPRFRYQIHRFRDRDLLVEEPLRFEQDDLRQRPDECGRRLVERIYDAFQIDLLPSLSGVSPAHTGLPVVVGPDGRSRWVSLDLGGGVRKPARLRSDNHRPYQFEWETADGDLIPADGRWVHGWRYVE
ncbi:MAG TPA: ATP-binding protein [Thermoanaerobaculia bacterium]|nr:ATP-binding protein [Thermoanaerobaculia bacterium]